MIKLLNELLFAFGRLRNFGTMFLGFMSPFHNVLFGWMHPPTAGGPSSNRLSWARLRGLSWDVDFTSMFSNYGLFRRAVSFFDLHRLVLRIFTDNQIGKHPLITFTCPCAGILKPSNAHCAQGFYSCNAQE